MNASIQNYIYEHEVIESSLVREKERLNDRLKVLLSEMKETNVDSQCERKSETDNSNIESEISIINDRLTSIDHRIEHIRDKLSAALKLKNSRWTRCSMHPSPSEYKPVHTLTFPTRSHSVPQHLWHPMMAWYVEQ